MPVILKNEWKSGWKSLLIWALSVGGMGLICIILYKGMEDSMADMAESFATMGTFSDAFGRRWAYCGIYVYTSGFTGQGNSNEVFCSATKPYLFYIDLWHAL